MKRYIKLLLLGIIGPLFIVSCGKSYLGIEQVKTDSTAPGKIAVKEVVSRSGGLEIHFNFPQGNPNIAQVVASYTNKRGELVEFKASRYSSSILVEGFTGTDEKTVELVCIDDSGNKSEPIVVKSAPLLSPVEIAFNTMNVEPTFGGVKIDWENKDAQPFAIHVLTEDMLQVGVVSLVEDPTKTIYNRDSVNTYAYIRQYPFVEQKFGFALSDKWGNRTDTLLRSLTPFQEEKIDHTRIKPVTFFNPTVYAGNRDYGTYGVNRVTGIQNDGNSHNNGSYAPATVFDGVTTGLQFIVYKFVKNFNDPDESKHEIVQDVYVTYDLNMDVQLNRVKVYPRVGANYVYTRSSLKRFRIWGTNDANNQRWTKFPETWTLIGEYVGPDPVTEGSPTQEEIDYFNLNREHLIIEDNVNPHAEPSTSFRYMRLQLMESYTPTNNSISINEIEMFGIIEQTY